MRAVNATAKPSQASRVLYILDEPTTGLHFDDVSKLLTAFRKLIDGGGSLIVIEHNLDVIKSADWAVSYTHLDVYKRQGLRSPMPTRSTGWLLPLPSSRKTPRATRALRWRRRRRSTITCACSTPAAGRCIASTATGW